MRGAAKDEDRGDAMKERTRGEPTMNEFDVRGVTCEAARWRAWLNEALSGRWRNELLWVNEPSNDFTLGGLCGVANER